MDKDNEAMREITKTLTEELNLAVGKEFGKHPKFKVVFHEAEEDTEDYDLTVVYAPISINDYEEIGRYKLEKVHSWAGEWLTGAVEALATYTRQDTESS